MYPGPEPLEAGVANREGDGPALAVPVPPERGRDVGGTGVEGLVAGELTLEEVDGLLLLLPPNELADSFRLVAELERLCPRC